MDIKRTKHILSIVSFCVSILVGLTALFIPPPGIIDLSVLWWIAQLLAFTAGMLGVDFNVKGMASTSKKKDKYNEDEED